MRSLNDLRAGEAGRIARITHVGPITKRILDMGMVKGTVVKVVKVAPLGDPIEVKIKGCNISLRRGEASTILVDETPEAGN